MRPLFSLPNPFIFRFPLLPVFRCWHCLTVALLIVSLMLILCQGSEAEATERRGGTVERREEDGTEGASGSESG